MTRKQILSYIIVTILVWTVIFYSRPPKRPKIIEPGTITQVGDNYIEVSAYGRFLVTPKQAKELKVGEKAPKEIIQRGS